MGVLGNCSHFVTPDFLTYRMTYRNKYLTSGQENRKLRMNLADKIRKLPLSYLGRRDLSDLTTAIMDDVSAVEGALTNGVTEFIGGALSGLISILLLLLCDWRLGLSLGLCLPVVALVMALCRGLSEGTNKKNKQKSSILVMVCKNTWRISRSCGLQRKWASTKRD